ncbi:MAG: ECF-type sigma factor [Bacteroidota bacterium]
MPTTPARASTVTRLLQESESEVGLVDRLLPHVYDELRDIARAQRRRQGAPDTLLTTALVHEAYLRLVGRELVPNRSYFFAAAAQAMRNVLVDHARRHIRRPQGHGVAFDAEQHGGHLDQEAGYILDVHAALERLAAFDPRAAAIVECRFFGGLTMEDAAAVAEVSLPTAKRDWRRARAWLQTQLGADALAPPPGAVLDPPDGASTDDSPDT